MTVQKYNYFSATNGNSGNIQICDDKQEFFSAVFDQKNKVHKVVQDFFSPDFTEKNSTINGAILSIDKVTLRVRYKELGHGKITVIRMVDRVLQILPLTTETKLQSDDTVLLSTYPLPNDEQQLLKFVFNARMASFRGSESQYISNGLVQRAQNSLSIITLQLD